MNDFLNEDETLDDLELNGVKLIQKKGGFRFGVDAVLLSNFSEVKNNDSVIDLCSGTGIVPFILSQKTNAKKILGIEIQEELVHMAKKSVSLNNLQSKIDFLNMDLTHLNDLKNLGLFDVVTVNPPYKLKGSGLINPNDKEAISRHEIMCTLEDVIIASKTLLKDNGKFFMVHRPERLIDIVTIMRHHRIEPKSIKFVHPSIKKAPNILLIKGQKYGGKFLKFEDPLYIHNEDGTYTEDLLKIYRL